MGCVCVCVFTRLSTSVLLFCYCTCRLCRRWALFVSRSCPPRQVSGIYKPRQWKTDHRASSCHTSIPPKASEDSLQHALLFPGPLPTTFPAARWFCLTCVSLLQRDVITAAELCLSSEVQLLLSLILCYPSWHAG